MDSLIQNSLQKIAVSLRHLTQYLNEIPLLHQQLLDSQFVNQHLYLSQNRLFRIDSNYYSLADIIRRAEIMVSCSEVLREKALGKDSFLGKHGQIFVRDQHNFCEYFLHSLRMDYIDFVRALLSFYWQQICFKSSSKQRFVQKIKLFLYGTVLPFTPFTHFHRASIEFDDRSFQDIARKSLCISPNISDISGLTGTNWGWLSNSLFPGKMLGSDQRLSPLKDRKAGKLQIYTQKKIKYEPSNFYNISKPLPVTKIYIPKLKFPAADFLVSVTSKRLLSSSSNLFRVRTKDESFRIDSIADKTSLRSDYSYILDQGKLLITDNQKDSFNLVEPFQRSRDVHIREVQLTAQKDGVLEGKIKYIKSRVIQGLFDGVKMPASMKQYLTLLKQRSHISLENLSSQKPMEFLKNFKPDLKRRVLKIEKCLGSLQFKIQCQKFVLNLGHLLLIMEVLSNDTDSFDLPIELLKKHRQIVQYLKLKFNKNYPLEMSTFPKEIRIKEDFTSSLTLAFYLLDSKVDISALQSYRNYKSNEKELDGLWSERTSFSMCTVQLRDLLKDCGQSQELQQLDNIQLRDI